jgi:hypothetical protein
MSSPRGSVIGGGWAAAGCGAANRRVWGAAAVGCGASAGAQPLMLGRAKYRPGLPDRELRAFDQFVRKHTDGVLLVENQTGMSAPVAAAA